MRNWGFHYYHNLGGYEPDASWIGEERRSHSQYVYASIAATINYPLIKCG
jgi:hypothetical protein